MEGLKKICLFVLLVGMTGKEVAGLKCYQTNGLDSSTSSSDCTNLLGGTPMCSAARTTALGEKTDLFACSSKMLCDAAELASKLVLVGADGAITKCCDTDNCNTEAFLSSAIAEKEEEAKKEASGLKCYFGTDGAKTEPACALGQCMAEAITVGETTTNTYSCTTKALCDAIKNTDLSFAKCCATDLCNTKAFISSASVKSFQAVMMMLPMMAFVVSYFH